MKSRELYLKRGSFSFSHTLTYIIKHKPALYILFPWQRLTGDRGRQEEDVNYSGSPVCCSDSWGRLAPSERLTLAWRRDRGAGGGGSATSVPLNAATATVQQWPPPPRRKEVQERGRPLGPLERLNNVCNYALLLYLLFYIFSLTPILMQVGYISNKRLKEKYVFQRTRGVPSYITDVET